MSRSARRCHSCGKLTLPWSNYVALALLVLVALVLLYKFYV